MERIKNNLDKTLKYNWISAGRASNFCPDYTPKEYDDKFERLKFKLSGKNKHFKTLYRKDYTIVLQLADL